MAEEVTREANVEELRDQLDALWEKHLTLLDTYHQAQQQIARHFSSGFFDLAQATFKSTTRVRYGQEYYDDRMQATRRFDVSSDNQDAPRLTLKGNNASPSPLATKHADTSAVDDKHEAEQNPVTEQQPTPPSTPPRSSEETSSDEQTHEDKTADEKEKTQQKKPRDPLHWYGILVPPSLRSSQKAFVSALEIPVIDAANSAQALRHVALEIRKLRKDIKKAEKRIVV
ncbi:hypothetical protein E4T39_08513 [Aureobasidium subglaciale]|nr:hypothetical protein E4T39_08513 [Aureobasidium subglaciale]